MPVQLEWDTRKALSNLENISGVTAIDIATAFLESAGVQWIESLVTKTGMPKGKVRLFLSDDFSQNKPSQLLKRLIQIGQVYIVCGAKLHAKVIALHTQQCVHTFVGSANLTWSGINSNLELATVSDQFPREKLTQFFFSCEKYSKMVTPELITKYEVIEAQYTARQKVPSFTDLIRAMLSDGFSVPFSTIDLSGQYFSYEDYETIFPINHVAKNEHIDTRRKAIQQKMLTIHQRVKSVAHDLGLHEHWRSEHLTSLVRPCLFNGHRVAWVGVRYGKSENQIRYLNPTYTNETEEQYSFPKHACIQLSLYPNGFAISLFHAVRDGAWDRAYARDQILKNPSFMSGIVEELSKLKGHGYVWTIDNPIVGTKLGDFSLDDENIEEFPTFYKQDEPGWESSLQKTWAPGDDKLSSLDTIVEAATTHMKLLAPLYRKMAQIPKV